jgi:hypothetical protein
MCLLKIVDVTVWHATSYAWLIERESTMLVVITNSHYYALDFLWGAEPDDTYTYIYVSRNVTDIAAQ